MSYISKESLDKIITQLATQLGNNIEKKRVVIKTIFGNKGQVLNQEIDIDDLHDLELSDETIKTLVSEAGSVDPEDSEATVRVIGKNGKLIGSIEIFLPEEPDDDEDLDRFLEANVNLETSEIIYAGIAEAT